MYLYQDTHTRACTCIHPHPCMLFLLSSGTRHLPTLPGRVMLQWWGKIWPMSCCENSRRRWWELSSPLSLRYAPLHRLTWELLHRPREGPATCLPNEYKTKPLTDRWVTEVKCVHLLFLLFSFFFSFSLLFASSLFFFPPWHTALHQPIVAPFRKERMGREKQNRAKVWELFLLPLFPSEWFHC